MKTPNPSATVTINSIAKKKQLAGEIVYNFAAGDPILRTHETILNGVIEETKNGFSPYPPVDGLPELKTLAANWLNQEYDSAFTPSQVLVTTGGKFALFAALYVLLEQGDEVLIPSPYWVSYPEMVSMANGKPIFIASTKENAWKITPKSLLSHISPKSKILLLNSASNPTGSVYTHKELEELLDIAKSHNLLVLSDEVYSGLIYENTPFISCSSFPEHRDRVIVVQSCSKNFGMTGWRVGFAFGPEKIIKSLCAFQGQTTTAAAWMSQWAAIYALKNKKAVNSYVKKEMLIRRDLFVSTYNALFQEPIKAPGSAIYAFVSLQSLGVQKMQNSVLFCEQIIAASNVALVPGIAFGQEGYVRFAFSETETSIENGLHLLKKAIDTLFP